ncbi:3-keto-disaccharide hydrolase [Wocania ichthyoenteri]|uniref:3-keto-disaccharide hydrolase n=1 Tax=Wocania ichthyoenteri TaxID=1230531 RepID=UPI00053F29C1|nr:family 16 glycoside hydrolase [Wocania ichthyoenteri]
MKKLKIFLPIIVIVFSCKTTKNDDWQELFNGENLDGWVTKIHHHDFDDNYANTFRVVDGKIQVNYDSYGEFNERYGHLFYNKSFSSYHLKFEYKFTNQWLKDAPSYTYRNSGVMFHSQDPKTILKEQDWPISVEYQTLAEEVEGKLRSTGNMCSPGTEVFFNNEMDARHCISSSSKTYKWNEWVKGDLIVYKDSLVIHKVNGNEVLRYTKPQIGGGVTKGFNPDIKTDGKLLTSGYIALQSEGQGIEFRNIKIKEFN